MDQLRSSLINCVALPGHEIARFNAGPTIPAGLRGQMNHQYTTTENKHTPRTPVIPRIAVLELIDPTQLHNAVTIARQTDAGDTHRVVKQQQSFRRANRPGFRHGQLAYVKAAVPQRAGGKEKKKG